MLRDADRISEAHDLAKDLARQFPANTDITALRDELAGSMGLDPQ